MEGWGVGERFDAFSRLDSGCGSIRQSSNMEGRYGVDVR